MNIDYENKHRTLIHELTKTLDWGKDEKTMELEVAKAIERAEQGMSSNEHCLLSTGYVTRRNDGYFLNLNDTWAWACADGEDISREEFPEVCRLFKDYGWCGLLYWASTRKDHKDWKPEFFDNRRFIEFVANEERIKKEQPDCNKRAYTKAKYTIGED